jgi:hypothetical protein
MWATSPIDFLKSTQSKQSRIGQIFAQSGHSYCGDVSESWTDVMIFKIFSQKKSTQNFAFLTQIKDNLFKNLIITLAS